MSEVAIEKPQWSKKKRFRNLASIGRSAKLARVQDNVSNPELAPDGSLDESLILPRVEVFPKDEDSEEAEDVLLTKYTAKEVYKEWIASQCKDLLMLLKLEWLWDLMRKLSVLGIMTFMDRRHFFTITARKAQPSLCIR